MDSDSTTMDPSYGDHPPPSAGAFPQRLGDFRIIREVGKGGMGIVYEAVQESLGRRVALKVLAKHCMLDEKNVQRFRQESRAAALLHHTNIVPVFGIGEHDGLHYYVMQFIDGLGFRDILIELRRLSDAVSTPSESLATDSPPVLSTRGDESAAETIAQALLSGQFGIDGGENATADPSSTVLGAQALGAQAQPPNTWDGQLTEMPTIISARPAEESGAAEHSDSQATQAHGARTPSDEAVDSSPESVLPYRTPVKLDRRYWGSVAKIGIRVAEAIDYAHGHGVLHRDIKPSNLLVDTNGGVWVTDFGLAKAAGSDDLTLTGDIVGTIRYMAPERFDGQGDVRSDIYSLGLTLYELLTHCPAFPDTENHQLMKSVLTDDPPRARKLRPDVPRDLETIVLKAMAREPHRRYQTARELAEDLNRFVKTQPIKARRSSQFERAWMWCRRNPIVSGLSAALLAVFLVSFVTVVWLWRDAEHQKARLALSETSVRHERDAALAATADAQRAIAAAVQAEEAARLSAEEAQRHLIQLEMNLAQAERHQQHVQRRMARFPTEADFHAVGATNFHNLAGLQYASGKTDQAIKSYQKAVEAWAMLVVDHPDVTEYQDGLATSYHRLGKVHAGIGDADEAIYYYTEALGVRETLAEQEDAVPEHQAALATSLFTLGELQPSKGKLREARRHLLKALQIQEELVNANPTSTKYREPLAKTCTALGQLDGQTAAESIAFYRKAIEHWQAIVDGEPFSADRHLAYAEASRRLGDAVRNVEGAAVALQWYVASIESLQRVLQDEPRHTLANKILAITHEAHAWALAELDHYDEAVAEFDLALSRVAEKDRSRIRFGRAVALAQAGMHEQATAEAMQIGRTNDVSAESAFMAAKVYSLASVTVANDKNLGGDVQVGLAQQYGDEAMSYLRACRDAGYFRKTKNIGKLEGDPDFRHLRQRDDFQALQQALHNATAACS